MYQRSPCWLDLEKTQQQNLNQQVYRTTLTTKSRVREDTVFMKYMMYLVSTEPHPHGRWQLQDLLGNLIMYTIFMLCSQSVKFFSKY